MKKTAKYRVILFQPYLRRFVLNFGKALPHFTFESVAKSAKVIGASGSVASFQKEVSRDKSSLQNRLRRFLGIPNVRVRLKREGDLFFTYGSLLISREPYCTYIETGLALYNYDLHIARNPLARALVVFLATRRNCHQLIFVSEASKKSFFATVSYPTWAKSRLLAKSIVIYPIPITQSSPRLKRFNGSLKLFFPGQFYIKGGLEVAHAFQCLHRQYPTISLTIVTAFNIMRPQDIAWLKKLPGLTLLDAKLSEQEMIELYQQSDIFVLPTMREGFGLVIVEALAYGLPVIITDQYATTEMAKDGYNGFIYPNHPLKDYDPTSFQMYGQYYNPKDFYAQLFALQKKGALKPLEDFLVTTIEKFIKQPELLEQLSRHSLALYQERFLPEKLSQQIDQVFLAAVKPR